MSLSGELTGLNRAYKTGCFQDPISACIRQHVTDFFTLRVTFSNFSFDYFRAVFHAMLLFILMNSAYSVIWFRLGDLWSCYAMHKFRMIQQSNLNGMRPNNM